MKLFRLRFILLGLSLCVCHVWCLICGTEFDDAASSAFFADIVLIGKVSQRFPPVNNRFNATVLIKNKRSIVKGKSLLQGAGSTNLYTVGEFGDEDDARRCVPSVEQDTEYIFFLNATLDSKYFVHSALPLSEKLKREFKRAKKDIKKILCSKSRCAKLPIADVKGAMKDAELAFGKTLALNCKLKARTLPGAKYTWYKDGVDIRTLNIKRLSIKSGTKGSKLKIGKAGLSDAGKYECEAKNVGGSIKQQAVITFSVSRPVPNKAMKNKKQKFGERLRLTCKIKKGAMPTPKFSWYKDGQEIRTDKQRGLTIKDRRGQESVLRKDKAVESDAGKYQCIARNEDGEAIQTSVVTIINAPPKTKPCKEEDKDFCLNGGTCEIMVEIDTMFCTCPESYQGSRCERFVIEVKKLQEGHKLAQDRNLIIVGIISVTLLFIGICVASYFLARRRRNRFRQRQRAKRNIEDDNIPQVYRPLISCDDVDGLKRHANGVAVHRETQTIETCFLGSDNTNLYINPLEGYIRPNREDRNSRARKAAISLEGYPAPDANGYKGDPRRCKSDSSDNNNDYPKPKANSNKNSRTNFESDGAPNEVMNDLSHGKPRHGSDDRSYDRPVAASSNVRNIPSVSSPNKSPALAFIFDNDSDDDSLSDAPPLTPLHISEDEDNNDAKKSNKTNRNSVDSTDKNRHPSDKPNIKETKNGPPDYNTTVKDDKPSYTPNDKLYASSSSVSSGSSSTTTEGCDSPNTVLRNEHSLSDPALDAAGKWNERGSPEITPNPHFFQFPMMKNVKPNIYPKQHEAPRYNSGSIIEQDRQQRLRYGNRDRKQVAL